MVLARGWSPTERQRLAALFVVGTVLLLNPLYVGVFHLDGTAYEYRTTPVAVEDGRIVPEVGRNALVRDGIDGIACSGPLSISDHRTCAFEARLVSEGSVTSSVPTDETVSSRYVAVGGAYYYRNTTVVDDRARLSVDPVSASTVRDDVAVAPDRLPLAARWALLTGATTTAERRAFGGRIVETDDGYRLLYLHSYRYSSDSGPEPFVSGAGIIAGLLLIRRGYRALGD